MEAGREVDQKAESDPDPVAEGDNPNDALTPPHPSAVYATRHANFRCGGIPVDYLPTNGLVPGNPEFILLGTCCPYPSMCGDLNGAT